MNDIRRRNGIVPRRFARIAVLLLVLSLAIGVGGLVPTSAQYTGPYVSARQGMATSTHGLASLAAVQMLQKGGNAVDALIALASMQNVVFINMSGCDGNGLMTIYWAETGEVYSLHMTGAAPYAFDPEVVTGDKRTRGYLAGCVPGNFGGWIAALQRFGTMSLAEVLGPAIYYAENGFPVSASYSASIADAKTLFETYPSSARVYLPGGKAPQPGELLVQTDLANTLKKVVAAEQRALKQGKSRIEALQAAYDRFYKGDIAQEIANFYKEVGGLFTLKDLADYQPTWKDPLHITYKGYDVYANPPTSRTGMEVLLQLNLIEGYDLAKMGYNSPQAIHLTAECITVAKSDVYAYIADPKFTDMPIKGMLSKEYAAERRKVIDPAKAMVANPAPGDPWKYEGRAKAWTPPVTAVASTALGSPPGLGSVAFQGGGMDEECTTSFSVVDKFGNAVGCTPTHGSGWGTGVVVGNTGLIFNNGTRANNAAPYPGHVNAPAGGKISLLGNGPMIVTKNGKLFMVFGSPGGEGIGQTQFQVFLNVVEFGMNMQDAVAAPGSFSLSASPDFFTPGAAVALTIDKAIAPETVKALEAMGHKVKLGSRTGSNHGIMVDPKTGTLTGGCVPGALNQVIGY